MQKFCAVLKINYIHLLINALPVSFWLQTSKLPGWSGRCVKTVVGPEDSLIHRLAKPIQDRVQAESSAFAPKSIAEINAKHIMLTDNHGGIDTTDKVSAIGQESEIGLQNCQTITVEIHRNLDDDPNVPAMSDHKKCTVKQTNSQNYETNCSFAGRERASSDSSLASYRFSSLTTNKLLKDRGNIVTSETEIKNNEFNKIEGAIYRTEQVCKTNSARLPHEEYSTDSISTIVEADDEADATAHDLVVTQRFRAWVAAPLVVLACTGLLPEIM